MRVLVITLNAWNNANSTGNTITNLFSSLSRQDEVANIYCRNEKISNSICKRYFRITEQDIVCHLLSANKCGNLVDNIGKHKQETGVETKNKLGIFLRKHRYTFLLLLRELIWCVPVWKNRKLENYLIDFAPDVIYMHGHNNLYMHRLLDYCAKKTCAKIVLYWGDDMYGRKLRTPLGYFYETLLRKRYRKSIQKASLLFGGSLMLCEEYSTLFCKKFVPFFKECRYLEPGVEKKIGNCITIVYAGNLLFGREQMMIDFIKSIEKVNTKKLPHKFILKIFSNTNLSDETMRILDDKENSCFMGCKPYLEVCEEMDRSELVLFIESFEKQSIMLTRLSFSTKIIDCMQSTAGILAIGPKEIASIDYLSRNNLGYIISELSEIENKLEYLANHPEIIQENNRHKFEYAKKYHTNTSIKALNEIRNIL